MRFYFHLHNDIDTIDKEGTELPDELVAREHAKMEARVMAAESVRNGSLNLSHYVAVTDGAGSLQFQVTFGEVLEITTGSQWD